ncbi:hypothetical protein [Nocardia sp. NPDC057030]|uniref:hypothetical protein n=1 Tax=unclassified Nocardia TaxID=2637762 RepID=UPI00363934A1
MVNERLRADAAMMLEAMTEQMQGVARVHRDRARLMATVTACDKRIAVTVNADGILIETRFADDIGDLSYSEIAAAITEAVQGAAKKVSEMQNEVATQQSQHQMVQPGSQSGMPMGPGPGPGGAQGAGGEYKRPKYLDSETHLDEGLGPDIKRVRPVIEP